MEIIKIKYWLFIIMSTPPKSIRKIFDFSNKRHTSRQRSPETPKRRPIFSEQHRGSTINKKDQQVSKTQRQTQQKAQTINFLEKMLQRVESKSKLLDLLAAENEQLKKDNEIVRTQNQEVIKKIAIFSGVDKLKDRNSEYRTKLLKVEALLYQLKQSAKTPIRGLDQLLSSLQN